MKADLTRDTFDPLKHFTRVVMQQGRVQLDADWNEQASILLHYLQTLAADLIGPHGGPGVGFEITGSTPASHLIHDFVIRGGRYYVDGVLCELSATAVPATVVKLPDAPAVVELHVPGTFVDGLEFRKDQYIELFTGPALPPVTAPPGLAKIGAVDLARNVLTIPASAAVDAPVWIRRATTYTTQPDLPSAVTGLGDGSYVVYLDVWERHLTSVEDDTIAEVALAGPDTATRAKTVWQVKAVEFAFDGTPNREAVEARLRGPEFRNRGGLRARAHDPSPSLTACIVPPDSAYRGAENQLYRVEIHTSGRPWNPASDLDKVTPHPATFKWSRENGSVVFPIVGGGGTATVQVETLGRDDRFGLAENDWVEVQDDDSVLNRVVGPLLQVQKIDGDMNVTLRGTPDARIGGNPAKHPLLRRWDLAASKLTHSERDGAVPIVESNDTWLELEQGVQIQFAPIADPATVYQTGDYWLIPARTATGDVEWPTEHGTDGAGHAVDVPVAVPPAGVEHHYAPLAVVTIGAGGGITSLTPFRLTIEPVAKP